MHMLTWARSHQGSRFLCKFLLLFFALLSAYHRHDDARSKHAGEENLCAIAFSGRLLSWGTGGAGRVCAWVTYLIINTSVHGGRWHNHNRESAASSRKQWPGERESAMNDAAS